MGNKSTYLNFFDKFKYYESKLRNNVELMQGPELHEWAQIVSFDLKKLKSARAKADFFEKIQRFWQKKAGDGNQNFDGWKLAGGQRETDGIMS